MKPSSILEKEQLTTIVKKMKLLIPFIAFALWSCTPSKDQPRITTQDCEAGMFTQCVNSPEFTVAGETITLRSGAKSDFFNAPDGSTRAANAPLLMKEIDNTKPFTFVAKVKPTFGSTYDAGTLYLFYNEDLWQKFAYEMDERGLKRLVTVRTMGTSDDNNHDSITQEDVYMKISSDTKNLGFYYSLDGKQWQLVRLYRNAYPEKIFLALSSQSPVGDGMQAEFSEMELTEKPIENFRLGL